MIYARPMYGESEISDEADWNYLELARSEASIKAAEWQRGYPLSGPQFWVEWSPGAPERLVTAYDAWVEKEALRVLRECYPSWAYSRFLAAGPDCAELERLGLLRRRGRQYRVR